MKEDFSFENSYNIDVGSLDVFPEVSETVLISFHPFFFILFHGSDLRHSVFQLTYSSFCLSYSIIDFFQCMFHFNYCIVYPCLYFIPILLKSLEGSSLLTLPKTVLFSLLLLYFYPSLTPSEIIFCY